MTLAQYTRAAGLGTAGGGFLLLLSWAQFPGLQRLTFIPPATALALLAVGAAVYHEAGARRRLVRIALGALLAAGGLLTLLHYIGGWDTGIASLIFSREVRAAGGAHPGYPAAYTGLTILCFGLSLLTLRGVERFGFRTSDVFAVIGVSVVLLAIIGHLHSFALYHTSAAGKPLTLLEGMLLLFGGAGLLTAQPSGLIEILRDRGAVGFTARRLLPVPFLIPLMTALARNLLIENKLVDPWTGQWIYSLANVVLYVLLIWRGMGLLRESDQRRQVAEAALQEAYQRVESRVRQRTDELLVANSTLHALIESSPLAIAALDGDGRVRLWNRAAEELLGWKAEEVQGRLVPAEEGGALATTFERMMRGEPFAGAEIEHWRPDGAVRALGAWSAPLGEDGSQGWVAAFADLTEQRRLEAELRQSQKMEAVGRLAGGVAHDFNNLLTAIIGLSEVVAEAMPRGDPLRIEVQEIKAAGERAGNLTRQLLAFSRTQILQPELLDLNLVITDFQRMLRRLIGEDIELNAELSPGLPQVLADRSQIEQVLLNLAINARDAMPQGGSVVIRTGEVEGTPHPELPAGHYAVLAVQDTGTGMDEATKGRIFEPFFTTKPKGLGTGLGLSTVYGIVKQSGGAIAVESEPGRGSAFRVYLPVASEEALWAKVQDAAAEERPSGTETVLLVEDEASVRALARQVLARCGYRVLEAGDAAAALELAYAERGPIHLLLADVVMPRMNGRELSESLRVLRPEIKVLFMSGHTEDEIVRRGVYARDLPFLPKPFTPSVLARRVREVLDGAGTPHSPRTNP